MTNFDFDEIYFWMQNHNSKLYGPVRMHILPFRFYESCDINDSDSTMEQNYCPTKNHIEMETISKYSSTLTPELQTLGHEVILKIWSHMATREAKFLSNPTLDNAELELSNDL